MRPPVALLVLLFAALLEAGGDALIRSGLHASASRTRWLFWVAGGLVLFAYGWVINAPGWDFGRLLGIYVVCFFVVAQVIAWAVFDQKPDRFLLVGGCLVVAGGLVMSFRR